MFALDSMLTLVPPLLYLLLAVAGVVLVVRSRSSEVWARLALIGLGLVILGEVCGVILTGAVVNDTYLPDLGVYTIISALGLLAHFVGFALLVASALSGRAAFSGLGRPTPGGAESPPR